MKIDLPINCGSTWLVMPAEIVDVAPHLAMVITFAVHETPRQDRWAGSWNVSCLETGENVYQSASRGWTRKEAVDGAREFLSKKTEAETVEMLKRFAKRRLSA